MFKTKNNILYLVGLLILVLITLYHWKYYNTENMSIMPQSDIYWHTVSGENQFRATQYGQDQTINTNIPYTQIPMQNDKAHVTGMNKYLWDKQKQVGCSTCQ